jgi:TonB-like protein
MTPSNKWLDRGQREAGFASSAIRLSGSVTPCPSQVNRSTSFLMTKLLFTVLTLLFLMQPSSIVRSVLPQNSAGDDWRRLVLLDEEFSVLVPTQPSALMQPEGFSFSDGAEKVLGHRAYSGYADGFIFVIESYRAARPHKLLKDINRLFPNLADVHSESASETNFAALGATKYTLGGNNFTGYEYVFAGREHVYAIIVAAKTPDHPSFKRFLSSFTLGQSMPPGTVTPTLEDDSVVAGPPSGTLVAHKDTTIKAIVVWKPEPNYTQAARFNQRTGAVVLKGTFTSSGHVIITDVIKPLRDGLTEKAIAAAKNIKFFPAEKDGQLVSVSLLLEYHYNLY